MASIVDSSPKSKELIFPFIGGEEVNSSPSHENHRYIVNFEDRSLEEASRFPELLGIVRDKVKPERESKAQDVARWPWWLYWRSRRAFYDTICDLDRIVATAATAKYRAFAFLPRRMVHAHSLILFAFDNYPAFTALQARPHELWSVFFGSTMKDDPLYAPSDCFETFPFPENFESKPALEAAGKEYYEFRADLMVRNDEGLTKTYNRFHDPEETSPDIQKLRDLHDAMDRAVLDAYGWTDLQPTCEFLLDYEDEDDEETGRTRKKKKPWRYRWPDDLRDEVLARLLKLNAERAEEERRTGQTATAKEKAKAKKKGVKRG